MLVECDVCVGHDHAKATKAREGLVITCECPGQCFGLIRIAKEDGLKNRFTRKALILLEAFSSFSKGYHFQLL